MVTHHVYVSISQRGSVSVNRGSELCRGAASSNPRPCRRIPVTGVARSGAGSRRGAALSALVSNFGRGREGSGAGRGSGAEAHAVGEAEPKRMPCGTEIGAGRPRRDRLTLSQEWSDVVGHMIGVVHMYMVAPRNLD